MSAPESISEKGLARRYGIAAITLIANNYVFARMMSVLVSAAVSVFPNSAELADRSTDAGYLVFMLFNEVCAYAFPLAVYAFLFRSCEAAPDASGYKRFFGETPMLFVTGWFFAWVGSRVTTYISAFLGSLFGVPPTKLAFSSSMPKNAFMFTVFVVCTCVIAPVCEELIYRKLLLTPMRKYSDSAAALITALLFALSHFNFSQFLYTFAFGYFLAVIAIRSRSVIPCIICHILNNLTAGISSYLPETLGNETADQVFKGIFSALEAATPYIFIVAIPVTSATLLLRLYRLHDNDGSTLTKRLALIFTEPVFLVSSAAILVITFIKLYT